MRTQLFDKMKCVPLFVVLFCFDGAFRVPQDCVVYCVLSQVVVVFCFFASSAAKDQRNLYSFLAAYIVVRNVYRWKETKMVP